MNEQHFVWHNWLARLCLHSRATTMISPTVYTAAYLSSIYPWCCSFPSLFATYRLQSLVGIRVQTVTRTTFHDLCSDCSFVWLPYYTAANHVIPDQSNIDTCKFEMNYRFKDIFQEVYEENWKEKFEENSIWFVLIYPDFDYDCFSRMTDNLYMMHIGMSTGWLMTW